MSKNLDEYLYYNLDEIKRLDAYDLGKEEGIKQGIDFVKKEEALEMLKDNVPIEKISKYTKLSLEVIKAIQKDIR